MGLFDVFKKKGGVSGSIVKGSPASDTPGVVRVNPGSKVYHCEWGGCGGVSVDAVAMPEAKAVAAGLSRCKRCDWSQYDRDLSWARKNGKG